VGLYFETVSQGRPKLGQLNKPKGGRAGMSYQCVIKEVTQGEAGPGRSPERSQVLPFVAKEICQGRKRTRFSKLLK